MVSKFFYINLEVTSEVNVIVCVASYDLELDTLSIMICIYINKQGLRNHEFSKNFEALGRFCV